MRIISGKYKGFKLKLVPSEKTKSTTHLIRKVVFDTLGSWLTDKYVLDLFAGNGSYSFEALSRNAKKVYLVDNSRIAIKIINQNKTKFNLTFSQFELFLADYNKMLKIFLKKNIFFDLIILDPPYHFNMYENLLKQMSLLLNNDGLVVCEMHKKSFLSAQIDNLMAIQEKQYGDIKVKFYQKQN